ncbi:MAG TPA: hypothetical protein PLF54_03370, partial [Deltaproteobacteria bacterium]|nr:hypothetical protein [Deltaproteobacteria bacterium]
MTVLITCPPYSPVRGEIRAFLAVPLTTASTAINSQTAMALKSIVSASPDQEENVALSTYDALSMHELNGLL